MKWGPYDGISAFVKRDDRVLAFFSMPCEMQTPTSQRQSYQKLTIEAPESWTSSLQNYGKINFCCLSHSVYGILLWQPEQKKKTTTTTTTKNSFKSRGKIKALPNKQKLRFCPQRSAQYTMLNEVLQAEAKIPDGKNFRNGNFLSKYKIFSA